MLEDFYHSNIIQSEKLEYQELVKKWLAFSVKFEKTLDVSPIAMFHQLTDTQGRSALIVSKNLYITRFKDGAMLIMEVLGESKNDLRYLTLG